MALTTSDVARLARLARIELTDQELEHLAPQIDVIVEAVAGVAQVKDDDIPPTSHSVPMTNVMRDDVAQPTNWRVLRPLLEADAPAWQDDKFSVPRILEEEA
ncbi:MAG: Asp-tRNA(Asn)/Glu-tRNA(Gln) amidotransferase subunit GatC [Propionibacteriaceae bacterium]|nr:Asp-tRNA(Asn)/Glu-tRNA(Gln) amidotransferase subunit GatC [Propionibacteriaceae bacterium]